MYAYINLINFKQQNIPLLIKKSKLHNNVFLPTMEMQQNCNNNYAIAIYTDYGQPSHHYQGYNKNIVFIHEIINQIKFMCHKLLLIHSTNRKKILK